MPRKFKAIFLDRDGVLNNALLKNGKPYPPANIAEVVIAEDVLPALTALKNLGYLLIVVTNQPDVARGTTTLATVTAINQHLKDKLPIDAFYVCFHDDHDKCDCRKPKAGLLLQAATDLHIDLKNSVMVGDRWKDIAAGKNARCKTIWIDRSYAEPKPEPAADFHVLTFGDVVNCI